MWLFGFRKIKGNLKKQQQQFLKDVVESMTDETKNQIHQISLKKKDMLCPLSEHYYNTKSNEKEYSI